MLVKSVPARVGAVVVAAGCTWFFRDPERTPDGDGVVAPADGVIQWVRPDGPGRHTISTYLNLLDVHVTRAPCDATVVRQTYRPGRHRPAFSPAARENERMEWILATEHGELRLIQYAGTLARRIVAHKAPGDLLRRGEAIGLIRFGSRVDLVLPAGLQAVVGQDQRIVGGATVVATPATE
jgi:phosphatidylserine decarboxylase